MMMSSLLTRLLYDKRWFIVGWAIAVSAIAVFTVSFFSSFVQTSSFSEIMNDVPSQFQGLIGNPDSFRHLPDYIAVQVYSIRIPVFIMIMALILAQSLSISLEDKGLMRMITSTPMSRVRIMIETWLAGIIIMALIIALAAVSGYLAAFMVDSSVAVHELLLRLNIMLWLYSVAAFTIPLAVGFATGNRSVTLITGLSITIGGFLFSTFSVSVDWLRRWEYFSLTHYYDAQTLLEGAFSPSDIWVLVLLTLLSLAFAILFFRRRDILSN